MAERLPGLVIVSLGYVGQALARRARDEGFVVTGTTRQGERADALRQEGISVCHLDALQRGSLRGHVPAGSVVVITFAPPEDGHGFDPLDAVLEEASATRARGLIYLSTTGVYSERSGGDVDERSPVDEAAPRSRARLRAERRVLDTADALLALGVVFRLSAIYGPGRGIGASLRAGSFRLFGGGAQIINRIHVDDIVSFLLAAARAPVPLGGIYNLADDEPTSLAEHARAVAALLGLPPPEAALATLAPSPTLLGSKRVSSRKAQSAFGVRLRYPSFRDAYREGGA